MITSKTKKQLIAFVILTLVGVTFVGARYARLDRLFYDSSYTVAAQYDQSGGIFTGAEVTYRGVGIGQVSEMKLTDDGVDVMLDIENKYDKIPKDSIALVGNKSAVGEQYVELQPQTDDGPYLDDGSKIEHRPDRDPGVDHGDPHQPEQLRELGAAVRPAHRGLGVGRGVQRRGPEHRPDHRHLELVHRDRQRQLRRHHGADPRLAGGAADPGRQGLGDPQLRPRPVPVQRHRGRQRQVPPLPDRQRVGHGQRAAHLPASRTGSTSGS